MDGKGVISYIESHLLRCLAHHPEQTLEVRTLQMDHRRPETEANAAVRAELDEAVD